MRFSGAMQIRAPAEIVWKLIADPAAMTRYAPSVTRVHILSGGEGVGARSFTMVLANGRSVPCAGFVSVWEPARRIVETLTMGMNRTVSEYVLSPLAPSQPTGYRDAAAGPRTEVRWTIDTRLHPPILWTLVPLVAFLPVLLMTRFGHRHDELMRQLAQVAEADAGTR